MTWFLDSGSLILVPESQPRRSRALSHSLQKTGNQEPKQGFAGSTQRAQYGLIKEYTLNHIMELRVGALPVVKVDVILLMIEILRDLLYRNARKYGSRIWLWSCRIYIIK